MSTSKQSMNRRELLQKGALGGLGLAGLGPLANMLDIPTAFAARAESSGITPALIAAAKKERHLNVITLPRTWANYGEIMDTFHARYGLTITDAIPLGSSAEEIAAIKNLKGLSRAPDVVDVSPAWAAKGKAQGLFVPYKVATWETIPSSMKDPHGYWYGDYFGVEAFLSNDSIVKEAPKDWPDLMSPKLRGMIALGDDPRKAGEAFGAVMAASIANGGSLDNIEPGINFFSRLKKAGNFLLIKGLEGNIGKGATPVVIRWDYLVLADRDLYASHTPMTVTVPKSGTYAGYYCQAISKYAPNPHAARLWQEYLYTDEGQLMFLKGYTHPARYADLAKRHKIPASLAARLPVSNAYKHPQFASLAQITKAQAILAEQWGPKVAGS